MVFWRIDHVSYDRFSQFKPSNRVEIKKVQRDSSVQTRINCENACTRCDFSDYISRNTGKVLKVLFVKLVFNDLIFGD